MIFDCAVCMCSVHVQRAGRHAGVHGGAYPSKIVHWVEVDVPPSGGDARAPHRAAGLCATWLLQASNLTMPAHTSTREPHTVDLANETASNAPGRCRSGAVRLVCTSAQGVPAEPSIFPRTCTMRYVLKHSAAAMSMNRVNIAAAVVLHRHCCRGDDRSSYPSNAP